MGNQKEPKETKQAKEPQQEPAEKPVSLAPLTPQEAIRDILGADNEARPSYAERK